VQIANELRKWRKDTSVSTVYGGVGYDLQIQKMRKCEVIVATPGRLLDHLQQGNCDLSHLSMFVLDEADKMVEMGFIEDVERIMSFMPAEKQMLLFGATLSSEIQAIQQRHMQNPVVVEAKAMVEADALKQYYYDVKPQEKFSLLMHLLRKESVHRCIIFCSTRATVDIVSRNLKKQGIDNEAIHGKLSQSRRLAVMEDFNKGKPPVLVASAVAARGIDIKDVSHIFNYDLANDPQEYIHRIGRTARAGEQGKAITLLSNKDHDAFREIQGRHHVNIQKLPMVKFERIPFDARGDRGDREGRGRGGPRSYGRGSSGSRGGFGRSSESGPRSSDRDHERSERSERGKVWDPLQRRFV